MTFSGGAQPAGRLPDVFGFDVSAPRSGRFRRGFFSARGTSLLLGTVFFTADRNGIKVKLKLAFVLFFQKKKAPDIEKREKRATL